jgi:hypothetical protein
MWYKKVFSQIDENIKNKFLNEINEIRNLNDAKEKFKRLLDLETEIYNNPDLSQDTYFFETITLPIRDLFKEIDIELREVTGEPELDFRDIYTFPEWLSWKETTGTLSSIDLAYLISYLNENFHIYQTLIFQRPSKYSYTKNYEITDEQEKKFIRDLQSKLQQKAFQIMNIDKSKLEDPQSWQANSAGDFEKNLEFIKRIDWRPNNDIDDEGALLTFAINPQGISIMAEIADPMPIQLQKYELEKFLFDVQKFFPENWSKEIRYIDGGDFRDILSGKLDKNIKIYRMMSDAEYDSWRQGSIIPKGKYFALKKQFAVGTDFADEGIKEVFTFIVNRSFVTGMDESVVVNTIPLRLQNNLLIPA